jgi:hypothetical protein
MAFAFISVWTALSAGARLGTLQDDTPHQIHLARLHTWLLTINSLLLLVILVRGNL